MQLATLMSAIMAFEAACYFAVAYWMGALYRSALLPLNRSISAGGSDWLIGGLFVAAAIAYWRIKRSRSWLQAMSIFAGVYGLWSLDSLLRLGGSWNIFSGDIVAVSKLSSVGLLLMGLVAAIDFWRERRLQQT